ncbi:MAG: hypothetical protein ABMB14_18035 [Myxococcota bacterium]
MPQPERPPPLRLVEPQPPGWPDWIEEWVLPYLREPTLWPVLVALLGHVVVGLVPPMLAVWRTGSAWAAVALALVAVGSLGAIGFEVGRFRRPGAVSLAVIGTWALAVGTAILAARTGLW